MNTILPREGALHKQGKTMAGMQPQAQAPEPAYGLDQADEHEDVTAVSTICTLSPVTSTESLGSLLRENENESDGENSEEHDTESDRNSAGVPQTIPQCNACPCCADTCGQEGCITCELKEDRLAKANTAVPFWQNFPWVTATRNDTEQRGTAHRRFTMCQVRRHCTRESAWLVVGKDIYDATEYIARHPGGETSILKRAGGARDCSVDFQFHSKRGQKLWREYLVGRLVDCKSEALSNR